MQLDKNIETLLYHSSPPTQEEIIHALKTMQTTPNLELISPPNNKMIPYNRILLSQTKNVEVLLMCWSQGMSSAPHDHGQSYGSVKVIKGCLSNTYWQINNNKFSCLKTTMHNSGEIISIKSGKIHAMANISDTASYSLHVYVKPIHKMKVYNPERNRYCVVPDDHGAWWPQDKKSIINERSIL